RSGTDGKSSRSRDALASTRDGRATQIARVQAHTEELRFRRDIAAPIDWSAVRARFIEGQQLFFSGLCSVLLTQPFVIFARFLIKRGFEFLVEQGIYHAHRARRVEHVHGAGAIMRRDLHRGVRPAGSCAPIKSGKRNPSRSISCATCTISSSDGVIRPLRPITSACFSRAVSKIFAAGTITPRSTTS